MEKVWNIQDITSLQNETGEKKQKSKILNWHWLEFVTTKRNVRYAHKPKYLPGQDHKLQDSSWVSIVARCPREFKHSLPLWLEEALSQIRYREWIPPSHDTEQVDHWLHGFQDPITKVREKNSLCILINVLLSKVATFYGINSCKAR